MEKTTRLRIWKCFSKLPKILFMHIDAPKPVWWVHCIWGFLGRLCSVCGKFPLFKKSDTFQVFIAWRSIAVAKLEQSLVAEAFGSDLSHQSSPEAANLSHLPSPGCPGITQHILASSTPPPPSIRLYCRCGMPGMSTGSPVFSVPAHNPQWEHKSSLALMVFFSQVFLHPKFSNSFSFLRVLLRGICVFSLPRIPVTFERHTLEAKELGGRCDS